MRPVLAVPANIIVHLTVYRARPLCHPTCATGLTKEMLYIESSLGVRPPANGAPLRSSLTAARIAGDTVLKDWRNTFACNPSSTLPEGNAPPLTLHGCVESGMPTNIGVQRTIHYHSLNSMHATPDQYTRIVQIR